MKTLLTLLAMLFTVTAFAQSNEMKARMEYEGAEEAYVLGNYSKALEKLEKTESILSKSNQKTSYLKIQIFFNLSKQNIKDKKYVDALHNLNKTFTLTNEYLDKDFSDEQKYRNVYSTREEVNSEIVIIEKKINLIDNERVNLINKINNFDKELKKRDTTPLQNLLMPLPKDLSEIRKGKVISYSEPFKYFYKDMEFQTRSRSFKTINDYYGIFVKPLNEIKSGRYENVYYSKIFIDSLNNLVSAKFSFNGKEQIELFCKEFMKIKEDRHSINRAGYHSLMWYYPNYTIKLVFNKDNSYGSVTIYKNNIYDKLISDVVSYMVEDEEYFVPIDNIIKNKSQ